LPSWTPDGRRLTFTSWRVEEGETEGEPRLYVMNADGSDQRRLPTPALGTSAGASWAPDGETFLVTRTTADFPGAIHRYRADGSGETLLAGDPETYYRSATYSPDGAWIAFGVGRDEAADIRLMRADGSGVRTVLEGGRDYYPRFSPDGRWLVVCSARNEEETDLDVRAVPVDTGAAAADPPPPVWLATGPDRECEGSWRPPAAPAFRP
ncbi:MAG TPA: hypothetical protein VLL48_07890, partial [Longimicrobiales bacterium]|nr:hypothetical protein [Longimicrobiales bacterium]